MSTENQLRLENICCVRGNNTLFQGLNITAKNGDLLRIRGENGSGKTSLLRIIAGISSPDLGGTFWNKESIKKSDSFANDIAYLAHRDGIKAELTSIDNLRFYQQLYNQNNSEKLIAVLAALDISHTTYLTAGQLSFGQRRRLAFARLLLSSAKLWLLDEPFTGIDVSGRQLLEQHCLEFLNQGGMIVMTHHAEVEHPELAKRQQSVDLTALNIHTLDASINNIKEHA